MDSKSKQNLIIGLVVAALLAGGIFLLANSNDDMDAVNNETTSEVTNNDNTNRDAADATNEAEEQSQNIVELAQATAPLSTLVQAVVAADLVDTLSGDGPFTVFAPSNDAFAELPEETLADLLKPENKADLANILTYHVVAGKALAADLTDGMMLTTVQGEKLRVDIHSDGSVSVGGAMVDTADVEASNGVVHVIDSVLLPSSN